MNRKERLAKGLIQLGDVMRKTGLTRGTARHYANIDLFHVEARTPGGFRLFNDKLIAYRAPFIKKFILQGKSLEEIKNILNSGVLPKDVLIIDDSVEVSDFIKDLVKDKINVNINVAYDGFLAGRMLEEVVPDLIILDLHLPGVDGFKICENIRKDSRFSDTKILAVTGYDSKEIQERITKCGADAYLTKPFDANSLLDTIAKLIS